VELVHLTMIIYLLLVQFPNYLVIKIHIAFPFMVLFKKKNSNNNYLVNTEYLSFEYLIYTGDRIFYFDGKNYLFAKCVIGYDNNSNSYVMKCNFEGIDKKGIIYPTIVDDDTEKKSIKMDMSYTLNLGECKVEDEEKNHSSFTHITKLLLFVLILSLF